MDDYNQSLWEGVIFLEVFNYPIDSLYILRNKKSLKRQLLEKKSFVPFKIAILSGSTVGDISKILELFLLNHGIAPEFYIGEYNRFYEEAVFENSKLEEFEPDIIYVHTSNKNIELFPQISDDTKLCHDKLEREYLKFEKVWESLSKKYKCPIIQNNFEMLSYRIMGNADIYLENGMNQFIHSLNSKLYDFARNHSNFFINDINYLSSWVGLEKWADLSYWYAYKYCLNLEFVPLLCNSVANIIKSILGKNKKVLVVDLDNTLWGGVIGDDGLENIQLGADNTGGSVYSDFQEYIKKLGEIGVILCVCSKNEHQMAELGFTHPSSILEKSSFAIFKANWDEKYKNITNIINELNVMSDSVIFIDDNKMERESVEAFIPEITVPEIKEPENYIKALDQAAFFEVTLLSEDDKKRVKNYRENIEREKFESEFNNYDEYLMSLNMSCVIAKFNKSNIQRVTQLINKTNQFNLTTLRYTQSQVEEIQKDKNYITLCSNLKDKFGDNGTVTALIGKIEGNSIEIVLWIMSCRVFKRKLEFAIFDELISFCKKNNINKVVGVYKKTNKNQPVKDFYKELGFSMIYQRDNESKWEYDIPPEYTSKNKEIEVHYFD